MRKETVMERGLVRPREKVHLAVVPSMTDRRLSALHLLSPFVQYEILFLCIYPLEKATPAQK